MGFLLRYLATAMIGTLAIYYGLPNLKPYLALDSRASNESVQSGLNQKGPSSRFLRTPRKSDQQKTAALAQPERSSAPAGAYASLPAVDASSRQDPVTGVSESPPVIVINELGYTPSTDRIRSSGSDVTDWGVTLEQAPFFDVNGKRRDAELPGGTLVEQIKITSSSRGEVALCRIWRDAGWTGPYLIATANLIRFPGQRNEVDADELELLRQYCKMNAQVEQRKKELLRLSVDANPYAAPLRQLKARYESTKKKAEDLTKRRDAASGAQRTRLADDLRKLMAEEPRMRNELAALTKKYEVWKKNNGVKRFDIRQDAEVKALQSQMIELRAKLGNFGL